MKKQQKKKQTQNKVSEQELLDTIEIISKKLAYKFKFGYHELSDMKQQISIFALEGIENYDYTRPLENFLWTHVRNRLFNYKRDNYQRPDKPCTSCPFQDKLCGNINNDCVKYPNKLDCSLYKSWNDRNNVKKNLMYLNTIEELKEYLPNIQQKQYSHENKELLDQLEELLLDDNRKIYLKLKHGCKVYKHEIAKLAECINSLIKY